MPPKPKPKAKQGEGKPKAKAKAKAKAKGKLDAQPKPAVKKPPTPEPPVQVKVIDTKPSEDVAEAFFDPDKPPLAACGRQGWLGVFWAGEGKIHIKHWGAHNNWNPHEGPLDPDVLVTPGTPLAAACREGEYNGVYWPGHDEIHHVWEDSTAWGVWNYEVMLEEGMTPSTPLGACGRKGYQVVYWAGKNSVFRKHAGEHNGWSFETDELLLDLPISPRQKVYAACREDQYDGIFWPGEAVMHHLYHDFLSWGEYKYEAMDVPEMTPGTLMAAAGRSDYLANFWASDGKMIIRHWGEHNGWVPEIAELEPDIQITSSTPIYAFSRDKEYTGVVWATDGHTHHLYEDFQAWEVWKYEYVVPREEAELPVPTTSPAVGSSWFAYMPLSVFLTLFLLWLSRRMKLSA